MNDDRKIRRGRPPKAEPAREAERARMVAAAAALLREGGSAALTARAVAERLGVSVGSVYGTFDGLGALRLEANAATMRDLREHILAAPGLGAGDAEANLLALAHAYLAFARERRLPWAALFDTAEAETPPALAGEIRALLGMIEAALAGIGGLAPEAIPVLAKALWSGVHGIVYLGELGNLGPVGREDVPAMIDALVRAAVRGASDPAAAIRIR